MAANTPQLAVGDSLNDFNGALITVGATVKLIGTVTAVNSLSGHFRDITVALTHPLTGSGNPTANATEGGHTTQPGGLLTINVPGCVLVIGS